MPFLLAHHQMLPAAVQFVFAFPKRQSLPCLLICQEYLLSAMISTCTHKPVYSLSVLHKLLLNQGTPIEGCQLNDAIQHLPEIFLRWGWLCQNLSFLNNNPSTKLI